MKTSSSKTNCKAMLRLHRTSDDAWVVVEHISEHNQPFTMKQYRANTNTTNKKLEIVRGAMAITNKEYY